MAEENKALVRKFWEIQDREQRAPVELCAPDFIAHSAGEPPADLQAFEQGQAALAETFSDWEHHIEDILAEGDRVACRMRFECTHTGEFLGVPASGNRVTFVGMTIMRMADGKIAGMWGVPDSLSLMQQIGAVPAQS